MLIAERVETLSSQAESQEDEGPFCPRRLAGLFVLLSVLGAGCDQERAERDRQIGAARR